uniref:Uncharacterized protein n=1 Tax=Arundo donax TaxID=35708 RepID=A0A0A9H0A2_ARUDO
MQSRQLCSQEAIEKIQHLTEAQTDNFCQLKNAHHDTPKILFSDEHL